MKSPPLPALPVLCILIGTGLIVASTFILISPQSTMHLPDLPEQAAPSTNIPSAPLPYHNQQTSSISVSSILSASPFASDRSAYSRAPARPPAPPKPVYAPQFVGTLGKGDEIRAMIIWTPGQPAQPTSIGDDTPWGKLVAASSSRLEFDGPDGKKSLSLF